jgi:hypothetical protein
MTQPTIPDIVKRVMFTNKLLAVSQVIMLVFSMLCITYVTLRSYPIMMTSPQGEALALIDLNNPQLRNDTQIEASIAQFMAWFHSSNTATISRDTKNYLTLLSNDYREKRTQDLQNTGLYALVKNGYFVSAVTSDKIRITRRGGYQGDYWEAKVEGTINIEGAKQITQKEAFSDVIRFSLVARTAINPLGIANVEVIE